MNDNFFAISEVLDLTAERLKQLAINHLKHHLFQKLKRVMVNRYEALAI